LKVALPYWQDRISPVLDTADNFLIVDVEADRHKEGERINLSGKSYSERARYLKKHGVKLLLCGAASEYCQELYVSGGIDIIPWLRGRCDSLIEAFRSSSLQDRMFIMPGHDGCRRRRRRRKKKY
jgi:predicted Fe-Mo cluster-binding NifX family protein